MSNQYSNDFVTTMFPVEKETKIGTLDKPLIIESACPGFLKHEIYPAVPVRLEDQIKEQIDSVRAGATVLHLHPRNPETGRATNDFDLIKAIIDGVADATGKIPVAFTMGWDPWSTPGAPCDYVSVAAEFLERGGGNRYIQGNVFCPINYNNPGVNSYITEKSMYDGVKFACDNGIKPVYQLFDTCSHLLIKRLVIDTGVDTSARVQANVQIGKHDAHACNVDPWSQIQLITSMETTKANIPNCYLGVYPGGRNWLPMLITAITAGCDLIRVGIEDCYWMWPHKDDIIKKNSDLVKIAVELATLLGRRVVTDPDEARELMGIKLS